MSWTGRTACHNGPMRFGPAVIVAILIASVPVLTVTEPVDQSAIAKIKIEGFQRSEVMDTLSWLSDVYARRYRVPGVNPMSRNKLP